MGHQSCASGEPGRHRHDGTAGSVNRHSRSNRPGYRFRRIKTAAHKEETSQIACNTLPRRCAGSPLKAPVTSCQGLWAINSLRNSQCFGMQGSDFSAGTICNGQSRIWRNCLTVWVDTRGAIHDIPDSPLFNPFIVSNLPLPQVNFYGILTPVTGRLSSSCSVKGALPYDRSFLYWRRTDLICPLRRAGLGIGTTVAEVVMAITYLLCGIIALGLFVYLLVALLKPELF